MAWVWALVLALLWAQMLGLAHRVRHDHGWAVASGHAHAHPVHAAAHPGHGQGAGHSAEAGADAARPVHAHTDTGADLGVGVWGHLLAPADDAQDCRLYDQLGHAGPVSTPFGLWGHALPQVPAWVVLQALQPRVCVAFAARAPPASR